VGYEEGGQLTEKVRRRPYSVVLFDEFEKAHPDVMQILLQILEEGRLTDSFGRVVDFRNTIVILTSNLGADFGKSDSGLGFREASAKGDYNTMRDRMLGEAKRAFKPEFLNRIDEVIVFRQLDRADVNKILDLEMARLGKRLLIRDVTLKLSPEARDFLIDKGFDPAMGARPLRRAVQKFIEDAMAEEILRGHIKKGAVVEAVKSVDGLTFMVPEIAAVP
jgi:ATP-dependent Clp protease ATP-binding subunit ClpC